MKRKSPFRDEAFRANDPDEIKMKEWLKKHEAWNGTPFNFDSKSPAAKKRRIAARIIQLEREFCGEENW
jgi:hypothetical protein